MSPFAYVAKIGWNSLYWFLLGRGVHKVFGTQRLTHSLTDWQTRIQYAPGTIFQRPILTKQRSDNANLSQGRWYRVGSSVSREATYIITTMYLAITRQLACTWPTGDYQVGPASTSGVRRLQHRHAAQWKSTSFALR